MKKLLFFASDFSIGLSSLLVDQLVALHRAGVDVIAVAGDNEQEPGLSDIIEKAGVPLIRIPGLDVHSDYKRLVSKLTEIVNKNSIEAMHVQNNWQLALSAGVKHRASKSPEVIYTLHGFRHNHAVKAKVAQFVIGSGLLLFADHVICMTEYLRRKFSLLSYKINLIPLGIKDTYFSDSFVTPPTDALHLIFPAQFREGKNQDMIIRAFADFVGKTSDHSATLTLPGNGPLLEDMKQLAAELNIGKHVSFPGFVSKDEVRDLLLSSNVAIVASNSETFGQSIVEPYVLGRCIGSTPVGIAPEIIKDGANGYLYKNQQQLTEILLKLNENKNFLTEAGRRNFDNAARFRWEAIIKEKYIPQLLK